MIDRDLQRLHELMDGGLSPEEEREILERIDADPLLQKEFDSLVGAVLMIETSERLPAPASFTAEVIKRLPVRKEPLRRRIANFVFAERVLKWNVAAVATAVILILVGVGALLQGQRKDQVAVSAPSQIETVKTVTLSLRAPQAKAVSLAGDFNKWSAEEGKMQKRSDGTWTIEVPLKPGVYHYMFVVDGDDWVPDPRAESYRDDGFGNKNAVLRVNSI